MNRVLRSVDDLIAAGLDLGRRRPTASAAVLARYAVSVTPDMAELIDPDDRTIRSPASSSPGPRNAPRRPRSGPTRSATPHMRR